MAASTDPVSGAVLPLHIALMSNLGVTFTEIASFDALAQACVQHGRYEFFYAAAPLKVVQAAGSPINSIAIE